MTVFRNRRLVFLHIPKTGGRAVKKLLKAGGAEGDLGTPHLFAHEYVSEGLIDQADWDAFEKITIVRNPWARAVSAWRHNGNRQKTSFADFLSEFVKGGWDQRRHGERQVDFLKDFDGTIHRFERIYEAFPDLPRKPPSIDYRSFYDDETCALIARVYAEDIKRFGYTFENGDLMDA